MKKIAFLLAIFLTASVDVSGVQFFPTQGGSGGGTIDFATAAGFSTTAGSVSLPTANAGGVLYVGDDGFIKTEVQEFFYDESDNILAVGGAPGSIQVDTIPNVSTIQVRHSTTHNITLSSEHASNTASNKPSLHLLRSEGTFSSKSAVTAGADIGEIAFSAYTGSEYKRGASITSEVSGIDSSIDFDQNLILSTRGDDEPSLRTRLALGKSSLVRLGLGSNDFQVQDYNSVPKFTTNSDGDVTNEGTLTSQGTITTNTGDVVSVQGDVVANAGDIRSDVGNIVAQDGNVQVQNGAVQLFDSGNSVSLTAPSLTDARSITFPDRSGEVLLDTDIGDFVTGNFLTGTGEAFEIAFFEATQDVTGDVDFQYDFTSNSIQLGTNLSATNSYHILAGTNLSASSNHTHVNGDSNTIDEESEFSTILNGEEISISGSTQSSILNGYQNTISVDSLTRDYNTIANGEMNQITSAPGFSLRFSSVLNGDNNKIVDGGGHASILNGLGITIDSSRYSTILNGLNNDIFNLTGTITEHNSILGGNNNTITAEGISLPTFTTILNGQNNKITKDSEHVIIAGRDVINDDAEFTLAFGDDVTVSNNGLVTSEHTLAIGSEISALGGANRVIGGNLDVDGIENFVYALDSKAIGDNNNVFGHDNDVTGNNNTAIGEGNKVDANDSTAIGRFNTVTADDSFAFGRDSEAAHVGSMVFSDSSDNAAPFVGDFSSAAPDQLVMKFINGIGINTNDTLGWSLTVSDNARFLDQAKFLSGIEIGDTANSSSGTNSFSLGTNVTSSGTNSFAGGRNSQATSLESFAWGDTAVANGSRSVSMGLFSTSSGLRSFALGNIVSATNTYSWAIGNSVTSAHQGSFIFGDTSPAVSTTTADDQFIINAGNGVGINRAPRAGAALDVNGDVYGNQTKEVLILFENDADDNVHSWEQVGSNGDLAHSFILPDDYTEAGLVSFEVIGFPLSVAATGSGKNIDMYLNYGMVGELYETGSIADETSTYNPGGSIAHFFSYDITSFVNTGDLDGGDICGFYLNHNSVGGLTAYVGLRIRYKGEMTY